MKKPTKRNGGSKRGSTRGSGRLYKRTGGKDYPADSTVNAPYWLQYSIPNPAGGRGKMVRVALKDSDGNAITDKATAEAERRRIVAPFQTKDEAEALRMIQARLQDAEQRLEVAQEASEPVLRVADAWPAYLASLDRPDTGKATLAQYEMQWGRFVKWLGETHPDTQNMRDVTAEIAREFAAHLLSEGKTANTFNKYVRLLSLVWRVLKKSARLDDNPWDGIKRRKEETQERRELTVEEMCKVCDAAKGDLKLLIALGIYTGLRLGDCATLRWCEVDLKRVKILRLPNKTRRKKKEKSLVKINIHQTVLPMLLNAKSEARKGAEYVLPRIASDYARHTSYVTDRVQKLFRDCGIETGRKVKGRNKKAVVVGFHSLRHSFVSLCREANAPLSVVESFVGHSNPAMTRHYTHTSEDAAQAAIAALPDVMGGTATLLPPPEPLPAWVRELVETLTPENVETVKAEILKGGAR